MKLLAKTRQKANQALTKAIPENYHEGIPLQKIFDALATVGLLVLMEDGQPWEGFFCGREGSTLLRLGFKAGEFIDNAGLSLSWYKMENGQYEIVSYIS